ncbi:MAG TPA: hypothetical protein DEA51_00230 [Erysipelotrichaceae bacterium]|nr:hypothetical protein [Erysipelotrichaceae bacterium]
MKWIKFVLAGIIFLSACSTTRAEPFKTGENDFIAPSFVFQRVSIQRLFNKEEVYSITSEMELAALLYKKYEQGIVNVSYMSEASLSLQRVYMFLESIMIDPFMLRQGYTEYKKGDEVAVTTYFVELVIDDSDAASIRLSASRILEGLITDSMSDRDKIALIHDYIVKTTAYDESVLDLDLTKVQNHPSFYAVGVFRHQTAVCSGYARAFNLLAHQANIRSIMISSHIISHAWNLVYLNGEMLYLDATWNDPIPDVPNRVLRTYYLQPKTQFLSDGQHVFDRSSETELDAADFEAFVRYIWG